ncbi:hypothetical protein NQ314_019917 [Rhamnusium bicolor]|uniref:Uncharacterized protein n=1 Tax=Rhamnusium bicolor TaxID=1586634 RepID=A0AAV8WN63_9CUCU|nr:hypothetical protein NQ314_019917 [Rhamnusium bicolor]
MNTEKLITIAGVTIIIIIALHLKNQVKKRKKMRSWIGRRQQGRGLLNMLETELLSEDPTAYRNFLRLNNEQFEEILKKLKIKLKGGYFVKSIR